MRTLRKEPHTGDVDPTDLFRSFASESVHHLCVAIANMIGGPDPDPISRKLGSINLAHLLAEDLTLLFMQTVREALYSKSPSRLYNEIFGITDMMTQAIDSVGYQSSAIKNRPQQQFTEDGRVLSAPDKSPRRQLKKGVSQPAGSP